MDEDKPYIPENASEIEFLEQEAKQNIFIESEDLPIDEEVLKQQVGARQMGFGDDELKIIEGTAFKEIMDDMDAKGIHYSDVDIYSYIPESERLTPYLIFMEDARNRWYTDEFVEYLVKVSAGNGFNTIGYNDLPFSPAAQIHEHALNISFRRGPDNFNDMLLIAIDADNPRGGLNPKKMKIKYINNIFPGGSYQATLEEQNRRFWEEKGMTPEGDWLPEVKQRGIVRMVDADGNVTYQNFYGEDIPSDDPRLEKYKFDDITASMEAEAFNKAEGPEKWKMMRDKNIITEYEYQELLKGNDPFTPKPDTPTNVVDDTKNHFGVPESEFDKPKKIVEGDFVKATTLEVKGELHARPTGKLGKIANDSPIELFLKTPDGYTPFTVVNLWSQPGVRANPDINNIEVFIKKGDNANEVIDYFNKNAGVLFDADGFFAGTKAETSFKVLDTPGGSLGAAKLNDPLVFDSWIDNYTKTTTSFIDNLPLSTTVKNQFDNLVRGRIKNLATPGGVADAVDVWELGVLGLMIAAVAYKEYDEVPKILTNKAVDMFNSMTAPYNIPPVPKEQYDLDYEFINKVVETGEKFMPTDIIIKKVGEVIQGVGEKGLATGFGYVPTTPKKTDTMETKQKIQPGVQEEKMFEQAKPKKVKSSGSAGARIL